MSLIEHAFSFSGQSPEAIVRGVYELGWLPSRTPVVVSIDSQRMGEITPDWLELAWKTKHDGEVLSVSQSGVVNGRRCLELTAEAVLAALVRLPFELAAFGPVFEDWDAPFSSFGGRHEAFGWAVAFRDRGYRHIPGRDWLAKGPWRLLRERDVSLVLFHDLASAAERALADAAPGHEYMAEGYQRLPRVRDEEIRLDEETLDGLRRLFATERPALVERLNGARYSQSTQDFFSRHRILRVDAGVTVFVAWPTGSGSPRLLSKRIEALSEVAAADPPAGLDELDRARCYADHANEWTSESIYGELELYAFEDLPFYSRKIPEIDAEITALERDLGSRELAPNAIQMSDGWHFRYWLTDARRLVQRELIVETTGVLRRMDSTFRDNLPIFQGKVWGIRNGRLAPIG